jgi:hypothetical protein
MRQMAPESFGDLAFGDAVLAHLEPRRIADSLPLAYQADEFERHCIDFLRAAAEAPIIIEPQTAPEVEEPHVVGHHEITLEAGAFDVQVEIIEWKGRRYAKVLLDHDEEMPELGAADAAKLSRLFNAADEAIRTGQGADLSAAALAELLSEGELSVIHSALRVIQSGGHLRKATAALSAEAKIHEALVAAGAKPETSDPPTPVESKDDAWNAELLGRELHQSAKEGGFASDELRWEDLPPENRANYMILATKALDVLAPEPLARMEAEEELGDTDPAVNVLGRERLFIFSPEQLVEVVTEAAGAATRPLLEDNPGYVFPAEKVLEAIKQYLADPQTKELLRERSLQMEEGDEENLGYALALVSRTLKKQTAMVLRGVNPDDIEFTGAEAKALIDAFMGGSPDGDALNTAHPKLEAIVALDREESPGG